MSEYLLTPRDSVITTFDNHPGFSLCAVHGLSERAEIEMQWRGCLGYIYLVDLDSKDYWPLSFYDTVRIAQDTEMMGYTDDVGLIIIQEITLKSIIDTCNSLLKGSYIKYHKPLTKDEIAELFCLDQF